MGPPESRALEAIEMPALLATIGELVAIESCHGQEVAVQRRIAGLLREIPMTVDEWEIDLEALAKHPAFGAEIERDHAVGVVGTWGSGQGPTLILNGHVDVVPDGRLLLLKWAGEESQMFVVHGWGRELRGKVGRR